jgi:hypothetical protein
MKTIKVTQFRPYSHRKIKADTSTEADVEAFLPPAVISQQIAAIGVNALCLSPPECATLANLASGLNA